jgi:hypothetical protein
METCKKFVGTTAAISSRMPLDLHPEHHVFTNCAPGQQEVLLQHEGYVRAWSFDSFAVYKRLPSARSVKARSDI